MFGFFCVCNGVEWDMSGIKHLQFDKGSQAETMIAAIKPLLNKECFIALYLLAFILGQSLGSSYGFYNEFRVLEIALLLGFGVWAWWTHRDTVTRVEGLFFAFIGLASFFWQQPLFIVVDMLLLYLLYKCFFYVTYQPALTRLMVLSSLLIFLMLPVALWDYVSSGVYSTDWYPLPWNIRVYDSYFLILSIFATWFYMTENSYQRVYLLFLFLAYFAVLLDGGRSVALAYTVFIAFVVVCHEPTRLPLVFTYISSWLAYLAITYASSFGYNSLGIVRESSSGRTDLWVNGLECWMQQPIFGCGFYQIGQHPQLSAHPHNIFLQMLTETGLIGLVFLAFMVFNIARHISGNIKKNYFVMAALLAVSIDMSLSGVHIYPITQIALLWLLVFLLKNPTFAHAPYFNKSLKEKRIKNSYLYFFIYILITCVYINVLILNHNMVTEDEAFVTAPRFWVNAYKIFD